MKTVLVGIIALVLWIPRVHAQSAPPPSPLARALHLYDKGDYFSASLAFKQVVDRNAKGTANRERAEYFLGKTMFKLGLYAVSLAYFDRIVEAGSSHRHHRGTLKWLTALARVLPETSGVVDKIGKYPASAASLSANKDVRDQLVFLMGRFAYTRGKFADAIGLFGKVGRKSPWFLRAKFFEGAANVRMFKARPALAAFKDLLAVARKKPTYFSRRELQRFERLAITQIARLFYSTQQVDLALKYYSMLPRRSSSWASSRFEAAWAHFLKGQYSNALAFSHAHMAAVARPEFTYEPVVFEAVIFYKKCQYKRALAAVAKLKRRYQPMRKRIKTLLDKYTDNSDFYKYVRAATAGSRSPVERLVVALIAEERTQRLFYWVNEIDKELGILSRADKAWQNSALGSDILQELTLHQALARNDAGKIARERVRRWYRSAREYSKDTLKVRYVSLEAMEQPPRPRRSIEHLDVPVVIPGTHAMWNISGGFGKGPRNDYRFRIRSRCKMTKAPPVKPPPAKRKPPKVKSYDEWANDEIDGELENPDGLGFRRRWYPYRNSLIRVRTHFIPPILKAAENL